MATLLTDNPAPNGPGVAAMWARADKDAVGTAWSAASQIWFTMAGGVVTEVYFPDVDTPQIRDLQMMFTDGETFFHDAQRDFTHACAQIDPNAPGFRVTSTAIGQDYQVIQDVIASSDSSCLLIRVRLQGDAALLAKLKVYVLLAPHILGQGAGNSAFVAQTTDGLKLVAQRDDCWLALNASCGLGATSCGFVGINDGWTDVIGHRRAMAWNYNCARNGNVALTAEINRGTDTEFVLALGFCVNSQAMSSQPNPAMVTVREALSYPFDQANPPGQLQTFIAGWANNVSPTRFKPVDGTTGDDNRLFKLSHDILLSHEDKNSLGALVASLSIPWGYTGSDQNSGYHLVWPRDMCQSATALLAAGELDLPLRGLMFLATSQSPDGGWHQNFFINGDPYWDGTQLDEISYPIILAWRLTRAGALQNYNPKRMVLAAARALILKGPMTQEERWEENEGYSPSTLASNIAGLICAADLAENEWGDAVTAQFLREHADFLESHLESWCVTRHGSLSDQPYYIRLLPTQVKSVGDNRHPTLPEDPESATLYLKNLPGDNGFPAREIVDGGFLELVRLGVRSPQDPIIVNTVAVIDALLKDDLPQGPCYRRYNHDGYGQGDQGQPFTGVGVGRPWPLLTGERAHYEVAAGRDGKPWLRTLEAFAGKRGLIAEQLWNAGPLPDAMPPLDLGSPTGSAMPLAWGHAEYIKLVRSVSDGAVFDRLGIVAKRYSQPRQPSPEVWNLDRQITTIEAGKTLRLPMGGPFRLRVSRDGWANWQDIDSTLTAIGVHYTDLPTQAGEAGGTLAFTLFWLDSERWIGSNFTVSLKS
ncbi:glycoside hydrolase family 15 protein [Novosphingobium sp. Rr 2-17]|uniref:glycoside hydrolase family 15 protein n=1 Tax=Novosphingobium sp. Rr 2-17 TaxID=555793 RepID=UPI00192BBFC8|nr:glycoside hydrolase family 15 protein [Novosphingobium sp. Rr 2-17]